MKDKLITLVTVLGEKQDSSGFKTGEETQRIEVFAEVKSVGRSEYYEALRASMKVSIIFAVDPDDFLLSEVEISLKDGNTKKLKASKVEYDGTLYQIVRTYNKGDLELTCREVE